VIEIVEEAGETDPADELRFTVAIQIWHPSIDPRDLTHALGREPFRCWQAGMQRTSMRGTPLQGHWPETYWVARRRVQRQRTFLRAMLQEVEELEAQAALVARLLDEGGRVHLRVSLPGDANIGDSLSVELMRRLVALGVELDIEVFPDMD
jgi:hypothetical protein